MRCSDTQLLLRRNKVLRTIDSAILLIRIRSAPLPQRGNITKPCLDGPVRITPVHCRILYPAPGMSGTGLLLSNNKVCDSVSLLAIRGPVGTICSPNPPLGGILGKNSTLCGP
jgi:hypothetical protein